MVLVLDCEARPAPAGGGCLSDGDSIAKTLVHNTGKVMGVMAPDVDPLVRFALLPEDERAALMAAGRLIQSVDDLDGLPAADAERLRLLIGYGGGEDERPVGSSDADLQPFAR